MSRAQLLAIASLALPALALILWPLLRREARLEGSPAAPAHGDRRDELSEEKRAIYRALRELTFDREAGHLSEDDYAGLRDRYEARAAQILKELDLLEAAQPKRERREAIPPPSARQPRVWTRHPLTLSAGAVVLVGFGLTLGLGVARHTEPDRTVIPPGSRIPVPMDQPGMPGTQAGGSGGAARPVPPEMLRGMLEAARQSLSAGRYQEAIAAYQAVLKRDSKNVDAMTHLALIVAIGGHTDTALESLARAQAVDPGYAPAHLYRGQILYEVKQDYRGAIDAWEKFLALAPSGEDHARVARLIQEAKGRLLKSSP